MSENCYDVIIIGGGLVGASLACALQTTPLRVAMIEAAPWFTHRQPPSYDDRILALNGTSQRILQGLGIWNSLAPHATPIQSIQVSDQGQLGFTRFDPQLLRMPALGYVVSARQVGYALQEALKIKIFAPAQLQQWHTNSSTVKLQITSQGHQHMLQARLLVAADGENSQIRQQIGLTTHQKEYGQTAIIANVTTERPHQQVAYERFTPGGPLALLPLRDQDGGLIWTVTSAEVSRVMKLTDSDFLQALQARFGWRLGRFVRVGQRHAYPLRLIHTQLTYRSRVVIIGNAAHTLHPVAGQGFNLGLRDVATLAQVIIEAHEELGSEATLQRYATLQQPDQQRTLRLTDGLVRGFSNRWLPLVIARNLGLGLLDGLPLLKKSLAQQMAGLNGYPSLLARGLPLTG